MLISDIPIRKILTEGGVMPAIKLKREVLKELLRKKSLERYASKHPTN
jgi:hypothetical protein